MTAKNDWREQGQEKYLYGRTFYLNTAKYRVENGDHDHCAFCSKKFSFCDTKVGYTTLDDCYWVCQECFEDFKESYSFKIFGENLFDNWYLTKVLEQEIESLSPTEKIYSIDRILNLVKNIDSMSLNSEICFVQPVVVQIFIDRSPKKYHYIPELNFQADLSKLSILRLSLMDIKEKLSQKTISPTHANTFCVRVEQTQSV